VSADEAIRIATTQTRSANRRRQIRDLRRSPLTIGVRPAIVWGLALIAASIALGVGIGRTSGSGHSVSPVTHPTTRTSTTTAPNTTLRIGDSVGYQDLDAVSFVNDDLGFGVASSFPSDSGSPNQRMLVSTDDGGENWIVKGELPSLPCISDSSDGPCRIPGNPVFSSSNNGFLWATGESEIQRTKDGGKAWSPYSLEAPALDIAQFGRSTLIVESDCANGGCDDIRTAWSADGGWVWMLGAIPTRSTKPPRTQITIIASVASATDAYVITVGNVYRTGNSGASWHDVLADPCLEGGNEVNATELTATDSPVPTVFVACGGQPAAGSQSKAVFRSTADSPWKIETAAAWGTHLTNIGTFGLGSFGYVDEMQAVSASTVYMVMDRAGLIETTDDGEQWKPIELGSVVSAGGTGTTQFVDPTHGRAFFIGEGLYGTANGDTWTALDGSPPGS